MDGGWVHAGWVWCTRLAAARCGSEKGLRFSKFQIRFTKFMQLKCQRAVAELLAVLESVGRQRDCGDREMAQMTEPGYYESYEGLRYRTNDDEKGV
jgi:hypothetical protein